MDLNEKDRDTFRLIPGDILICEGGEPGRAAIWRGQIEEMYYQKALHRARAKPEMATAEYIVWLFYVLSKNNGFDDHITSATIAHLTGEKLKAMKIMLPPLELQQKFNAISSKISQTVNKQNQALNQLKNLKLDL
jgi:type I restriction enzyme S subunit